MKDPKQALNEEDQSGMGVTLPELEGSRVC